jgi:RNA polymerase sigma-70 factor (ECF subfamily)
VAPRAKQDVADEVLMLRFQRGDVTAFAHLMQRHKAPVFNFVLRHVRSQSTAEDLLQEVFLRVVQNASDFKHEARFTTWVYTIARNLCIDHFRKAALRAHESLDQPRSSERRPLGDAAEDPRYESNVERTALSNELRDQIVAAVECLPEDQREVFLLREVANLPFKEIAAITDTPENTVKSRMRYALERLQVALQAYEADARALV